MKAITVCQPYAELLARGPDVKPFENRTWSTKYRGPLAIHAGKSLDYWDAADERVYGIKREEMVLGAFIAVCDLVACLPKLYPADPYNWPEPWLALADHETAEGPYCFAVVNMRRLKTPIPWRGALGLWTVPDDVLVQIQAQRREVTVPTP